MQTLGQLFGEEHDWPFEFLAIAREDFIVFSKFVSFKDTEWSILKLSTIEWHKLPKILLLNQKDLMMYRIF